MELQRGSKYSGTTVSLIQRGVTPCDLECGDGVFGSFVKIENSVRGIPRSEMKRAFLSESRKKNLRGALLGLKRVMFCSSWKAKGM